MIQRLVIGFLVFCTFALGVRWWYVCEVKKMCCGQTVSKVTDSSDVDAPVSKRPKTLALWENNKAVLINYEQLYFDYSSHEPILSPDNRRFLSDVAAYCSKNLDKKLLINGFYYDVEKQPTSGYFENLGIARAAAVREILVQDYGMVESFIQLDHTFSIAPGGTVSGPPEPMSFTVIGQTVKTPDGEEYATAKFEFTNMTFSDANFKSGSAELKPRPQFVEYADSVKAYLEKNPNKRLIIIGHTDTDGKPKDNIKLGLARAEAGKKYFRDLGVTAKIEPRSEGSKMPVAPNETPEGKAKNRRINIQIVNND